MLKLIKKNLAFFLPFFLYVLVGGILVVSYSKAELHLKLNGLYNDFFDVFFTYITYVGDGVFVILVGIAFAFIRYQYSLTILVAYLLSSLLVQVLKLTVFDDIVRPYHYFEMMHQTIRMVPGVPIDIRNSFPSGHATSAVVLFLCLSFFTRNNFIKAACAILCIVIAYSRVYLSKHFFVDIYAGSIIGALFVLFTMTFFENRVREEKWKWLNKSLLT